MLTNDLIPRDPVSIPLSLAAVVLGLVLAWVGWRLMSSTNGDSDE